MEAAAGAVGDASSDALLAMSCFAWLIQRFSNVEPSMLCRQGLLSGLEQINPVILGSRFVGDTGNITVIDVRPSNFDAEGRRIAELILANFTIVFVLVTLPGLPPLTFSANAQEEYHALKCCLSGRTRDVAEVMLGFANADGFIGWGCLWRFVLDVTVAASMGVAVHMDGFQSQEDCVPVHKFWAMVAAIGATHNPRTVWVTCHGGPGFAWLMRSFLSPVELPPEWGEYVNQRTACFPSAYDLALLAYYCPEVDVLPSGCKGKLEDIARSLNVTVYTKAAAAAAGPAARPVQLMRCFKVLAAKDNLKLIAKATRGRVMSSCCWKCPGHDAL